MIFQRKKKIYEQTVENGFQTSEKINKSPVSLFNEQSGHRVQNDKLLEIQHAYNKPITQNLVHGNDDPQFAAAYKQITKHRVRKLMGFI